LAGDVPRYFAELHKAIQADAKNRLAHWLLGEIQVENKWVSIEEAQRRASADPRQAQYVAQRKLHDGSLNGQWSLANWCRKNDLNDEARFHWANVLSADPNNKEALKALDLRRIKDRLVANGDLTPKEELQEAKRAAERWAPKIVKWRRAVSGADEIARSSALAEISAITQVDAIPSLEDVTLSQPRDANRAEDCRKIGLAFINALAKMSSQDAIDSLVRHAVLPSSNDTRKFAIESLKAHDKHDYVPALLSGLAMPIEATANVERGADGNVLYQSTLYREGQDKDWATDTNHFTMQQSLPGRDWVYRRRLKVWEDRTDYPSNRIAKIESSANQSELKYRRAAADLEAKVTQANETAEALNARIISALAATTGQDYGLPTQWWDWWRKTNEYYAYDHPVDYQYFSGTDNRVYGHPYNTYSEIASCFVQGTPVWTKTGLRPVETIEVGDLVLSQDVSTGELKYEPVIGRTIRPPSEIVRLSIDGEELRATRGHPFFVVGSGWQMAKELKSGSNLHGLRPTSIQTVALDGKAEAYNLVVAELGTYFVGEHGFLVHDNTARRSTQVIVPGVPSRSHSIEAAALAR
jgi:hypothetical protein